MRLLTPLDLRRRARTLAIAALLFGGCAALARAQAPSGPAAPAAVTSVASFAGRIDYTMHRDDAPGGPIVGTLRMVPGGWLLDERSASGSIHASRSQSWTRSGAQTLLVEDPFTMRSLANAWVLLLGESAGQPIEQDRSGVSWTIDGRLRVYPGGAGTPIAGLVDLAGGGTVSFSFGDWRSVGGVWLPHAIVRLDDGIPDASYTADDYKVLSAAQATAAPAALAAGHVALPDKPELPAVTTPVAAAVWHSFRLLFSLFGAGLLFAAWLRRDTLTERLCHWIARDPRDWRAEGTNVFVSPEGILVFEGSRYRVGSRFFNRRALVQSSALFLRISAPEAGRAVVLARKFAIPTLRASGFTLVEALVASALFAIVIVAAVVPALIVLARADRLAQLHETATQIATNALVDEESALAYGTSIDDGSATTTMNGLRLTVTVAPGSLAGMHQVTASVDAGDGATLARVTTLVGPPVPAPESSAPPTRSQ